jgi:hypothetical protein
MTIDLSVIPRVKDGLTEEQEKEQLKRNMETLARLVAWHNMYGLNVRYILEDKTDNKYKDRAIEALRQELVELSNLPGVDKDELLLRIGAPHEKGEDEEADEDEETKVAEVRLQSLEAITARESKVEDWEFLVALKDDPEKTGVAVPNYNAAASIGLALAALRIAKDKTKEAANYEKLKKEALKLFRTIYLRYEIIKNEKKFCLHQLEFMVSGCDKNKKELAMLYALPPVVKMSVELIGDYHDLIQRIKHSA